MNFITVCQASGLNHSSLMNFFYLFMDVLKCSSFGWFYNGGTEFRFHSKYLHLFLNMKVFWVWIDVRVSTF